VLDCLRKCAKIANQCMDAGTRVQLLVELLNKYVYFASKGLRAAAQGTDSPAAELVAKLREEVAGMHEATEEADQICTHFSATLEHVRQKRAAAKEAGQQDVFAGLEV